MSWPAHEEREFWRHACRDSFWAFLSYAWGAARWHSPGSDRPWLDPGIHKPMCDWFEHHVREWFAWRKQGLKRQKMLAVVVSRETGKSVIFTKAGQLWLHLQDPELSTYTGSEKTEFAVDFLASIKSVLDGGDPDAMFTKLYGNWYDSKRVWKSENVVHAIRKSQSRTEPSFGTWGVESGLTGKHPDVLILDDPVSYEKMAAYSNWLQTVNNHIDSLIPVIRKDGLMIFVGTRYHDGDHFGRCFRVDGVRSTAGMSVPDVVTRPDGLWDVYFLAGRHPDGTPAIPNIWPEHEMKKYETRDPLKYAAQVMNDPANSEFNPLTGAQVRDCLIEDKDVPKNLVYTIHCDTAFKTLERQSRGDESVIQIWGHQRGTGDVYFIEGVGSNIWRAEDYANKLAMLIQKLKKNRHRIRMITDEMQVGGKDGTWELLLESMCRNLGIGLPPFIVLTRGKKKLQRIIEAAAFWSDGHVKLPRSAPGVERLMEQMSRIGSSSHDDWADAAADVFNPKCYQVMHGVDRDDEGNRIESRRPWDEYLKDGQDGMAMMQAELYGQPFGRDPVGTN